MSLGIYLYYIKLPRLSIQAAAFVCVSVCLCFRFRKNVRTDFHETFHGSYGSQADLNGNKNFGKCGPPNM